MKIDNDYSWSTHSPLINSLIKITNPELILELGLGIHSTPVFLQSNAKKLIFIENDKNWFDHMSKEFNFDDRCYLEFHNLGEEIVLGTKLKELSENQKKTIIAYYNELSKKVGNYKTKFLFVDNFACARNLAINTLCHSFDIIVYHDCQPKGIKWYEYQFEKSIYDQYNNYILKCNSAWTGCFVKKTVEVQEQLRDVIKTEIKEYCQKNNLDPTSMFLE